MPAFVRTNQKQLIVEREFFERPPNTPLLVVAWDIFQSLPWEDRADIDAKAPYLCENCKQMGPCFAFELIIATGLHMEFKPRHPKRENPNGQVQVMPEIYRQLARMK